MPELRPVAEPCSPSYADGTECEDVIDSDLPAVENMTFETLQKVKKLVMIISERVPFEPKMSDLWAQLATNNELGLHSHKPHNRHPKSL